MPRRSLVGIQLERVVVDHGRGEEVARRRLGAPLLTTVPAGAAARGRSAHGRSRSGGSGSRPCRSSSGWPVTTVDQRRPQRIGAGGAIPLRFLAVATGPIEVPLRATEHALGEGSAVDPVRIDLWEAQARLVAGRVHRGADPEYEEQILPLAAEHLAGAVGCSTSAAVRARSPAWRWPAAHSVAIGVDPTWAQIEVAAARARCGPRYGRPAPAALPFADGDLRRGRGLPRVRAHPRRRRCHRRGRARAGARRALPLLPQPPAAADAEQRVDRRPDPRPARAVLADR